MVFAPTVAFAGIAVLDRLRPRIGLALLLVLGLPGAGFHGALGVGLLDRETELGREVGYGVLLLASARCDPDWPA